MEATAEERAAALKVASLKGVDVVWRRPSKLPKKNKRSVAIGPPTEAPN